MNTIHVLHIDDDADFADVTASFIERVNSSVTVETAVSAEEGLDRLDDSIDCVVSDYEMPEIDGIELLESVRQEYPNLPFILFTGKGSEAVASEAISAGVTDYLQKTGSTEQYELLCKRIENAVTKRRAQTNYQELFQKVPAGLTMHDPDTGVIIDANLAFGELLGYEPDEFAGTHPGELSPNGSPFDRETANRLIQQTIETGQQQFEWQDQTKTGDIVWVMVITKQATIDGHQRVIAVVQDITEKKERERELERKEHIIQEMDDGVVVIQDQTITYANPAISEIISYPTEALLGDPMGKYIAPEYRETVRRRYEERLAGNDPPKTYEISLLANDGETVPVEITAARVRYGGEPATVSIVRDITERKQQIRTLERQNERLEEFASIVSHDLRNPLDVATTRLELAMDACDSPHLADIADAHDRMERLIDDLLVLARQGEQVREMDSVSLTALTGGCWDTVETAGATLQIDADVTIRADRNRLKQAVENLIRNAVEHGGSEVTVRIGELAEEPGFYVADDGPGISEDSYEDIFESGYTTAEDGTGFGLAIVREIVEAHDWEISATDSATGGARFEITGVETVS